MLSVRVAPPGSPSKKEQEPVPQFTDIHPTKRDRFLHPTLLLGTIITSEHQFEMAMYLKHGYECFMDDGKSLTDWANIMASVSYKDQTIPKDFERVIIMNLHVDEVLRLGLYKLKPGGGPQDRTQISNIEIKSDFR